MGLKRKMEETYDPYYCFYNTNSIETFIKQTMEEYKNMFIAHDNQIKFLNSKILQLENELEQIKNKEK